jgi:hypothetical protein
MNIMKKIILSFLSISFVLMLITVDTHAAGTGDNQAFTKDIMTSDQIKALKEKENKEQNLISPFSLPEGYYKTIAVPSFEQEKSYWCGPATVKQVLHYINGKSSSQSTIASGLGTTKDGTDFSVVDNYLNTKQSKNVYVYVSNLSYDTWINHIITDLNINVPVLLDLTIKPTYMPLYTRNIAGHILNVSGLNTKTSTAAKIRLTDPFDEGNRGVTLGNVWHPLSGVYNANMAHFRKAMIW